MFCYPEYLSFLALGAYNLVAPCYFTERTDRISLIRHLRMILRGFPIGGIKVILKLCPRVYGVLVAPDRRP
jgi:hypothetical protein